MSFIPGAAAAQRVSPFPPGTAATHAARGRPGVPPEVPPGYRPVDAEFQARRAEAQQRVHDALLHLSGLARRSPDGRLDNRTLLHMLWNPGRTWSLDDRNAAYVSMLYSPLVVPCWQQLPEMRGRPPQAYPACYGHEELAGMAHWLRQQPPQVMGDHGCDPCAMFHPQDWRPIMSDLLGGLRQARQPSFTLEALLERMLLLNLQRRMALLLAAPRYMPDLYQPFSQEDVSWEELDAAMGRIPPDPRMKRAQAAAAASAFGDGSGHFHRFWSSHPAHAAPPGPGWAPPSADWRAHAATPDPDSAPSQPSDAPAGEAHTVAGNTYWVEEPPDDAAAQSPAPGSPGRTSA